MSKRVTICMPVFNSEKFLVKALESIANQTLQDFEVIIVNDGSTDNSEKLANDSLNTLNLTGRVLTIENRGPESARDYGLQYAEGEYLAPLDSDDLWEPDYLSTMVGALDKNQDIGLAFSDFTIFDEQNKVEIKKSQTVNNIESIKHTIVDNNVLVFESHDFFKYALSGQVIFPSCSVYRKSFYEKIGPYTKSLHLYISCDWEFGLRAVNASNIIYVKTPLLRKRKHEDNISGAADKTAEADTKVLGLILDTYHLDSSARNIALNRLAIRCFNVGYANFERNDYLIARKWFLKSVNNKASIRVLVYYLATFIPKGLLSYLINLKRGRN